MAHWEYCLGAAARVLSYYMTKTRFSIWIFSGTWMLALGASSPPLTTAQQVLDLGLEAARRAVIPVRLQGLVTYPDAGAGVIYVQDSSAGIRVAYTNANYQPASGQVVVVEGSAAG